MKISQIVRNLLSNAFKFTKQGSVTLALHYATGDALPIRISVRDTGIGIPQNKLATIFEAFRQVDGSTMREYGGTGLGLTISLRFAQLLGGTIIVHSHENQGSEFTLCLPDHISEHTPTLTQPTKQTDAIIPQLVVDDRASIANSDQVILVIDDDAHFCSAIVEINQRLRYKTLVASTGAEGLKLAQHYRPKGILLDLGLPDMDGSDLLRQIKSSNDLAAIPVFIVSARNHDEALARHGILGYLQKPVDSQQIAEVEALLLQAITQQADSSVLIIQYGKTSQDEISHLIQSHHDTAKRQVKKISNQHELEQALQTQSWGVAIIDLTNLTPLDGVSIASTVRSSRPDSAILFYGISQLTELEEHQLRVYSDTTIVDSPKAQQRLLENIERFLTSVKINSETVVAQFPSSSATQRLKGKSILAVDDDPRNLFVITSALELEGARVIYAVNGRRALDVLQKEKVDLIITDIMMPEMDGYQTIAAVRANAALKTIPIVVLTAKAMPEDKQNVIELGADDYLSKPVDYDVLNNMAVLWSSRKHDE